MKYINMIYIIKLYMKGGRSRTAKNVIKGGLIKSSWGGKFVDVK